MSKISILGSGTVGNMVGEGFERLGHKVVFHDTDGEKVQLLEKHFDATTDMQYAVDQTEFSFVTVPTPTRDGKFDFSNIVCTTQALGQALKNKAAYHIVIVKSTVLPGTTEYKLIPVLETESGKKAGVDIGVCVNPEFLTQVQNTWTADASCAKDFFNQDRIVIGELDKKAGNQLEQLFKPFGKPIFRTDLRTAEYIKYAANCFLATKISYWNERFLECKELGIDSQLVAGIVGLDSRIGKYGTIHGKAFGGPCLPKDLEAFISFVEDYRAPALLKAAKEINDFMAGTYGIRG